MSRTGGRLLLPWESCRGRAACGCAGLRGDGWRHPPPRVAWRALGWPDRAGALTGGGPRPVDQLRHFHVRDVATRGHVSGSKPETYVIINV